MTDERLREAEREGEERGGLVAEARLLVERVRAGTFPAARLALLERIGDPRARVAAGLDPLPEVAADEEMLRFEERLAEAIVWCTERLALGLSKRQVLRSRELRPSRFGYGENETDSQLHTRGEWLAAVEHVARERRALLAGSGWMPGSRARGLGGGRLLLHDPRLQLFDGAAVSVSEELFDVDYMPPWDSWVAWAGAASDAGAWREFDGYVVSWVPEELVYFADSAIQVSPTETLTWAHPHELGLFSMPRAPRWVVKDAFTEKLEARGLLG